MLSPPFFENIALSAAQPLRFPQKLWKIANECKTGAVCWSLDGKSILIRYSLFKGEFMSTKNDFFKTDNIASFVRQLNLYGFRKVYDHTPKQGYRVCHDLHEFSNIFFQRNRPDLLDRVARKTAVLKDKNELESNKIVTDESPSDKEENSNVSSPFKKKCDGRILVRISQNTDEKKLAEPTPIIANDAANKENIAPKFTASVSEQASETPVKKKRGRKPGSKRKTCQSSHLSLEGSKTYYSPTLRNPEKHPELLYFRDNDDKVFLRNTSKDVMLSSTLPFEESLEYRELKAAYLRQCEMKMDIFRDYKSMFKNFF